MPLRIILILIVCLLSRLSVAGWTQIAQHNTSVYSCGYFFNDKVGFIGGTESAGWTGTRSKILYTINGGKTWSTSILPGGNGKITSIFMVDSLLGYASADATNYSLLKTTDGGIHWEDVTTNNSGTSNCVYVTSKAIITTKWPQNTELIGGVSTNNGVTFSPVFYGLEIHKSNGIDFLDDLNGVVTMGPENDQNTPRYTYYTSDGGISWRRGGLLEESWGVYADKTSRSYYTLPEAQDPYRSDIVYRSVDNGRTWKILYNFPGNNMHFTGHITGVGKTIYVQSQNRTTDGLFRSDDGGVSWNAVGGPTNEFDTRFFVTGCRGEVVYAFDRNGGIYKTTDGGDGTLVPSPYIASVPSALVGATVLIPVTYDTLQTGSIVEEIRGILQLNDNLIQPDSLVFKGTQLDSLTTFDTVYKTATGWVFDAKIKKNITIKGSGSRPLLYVSAHTYLTDTTESEIALKSIDFTINSKSTTLSTCTVQSAVFKLQLVCGDSTLIRAMNGEQIAFFAIHPNPSEGNIILSSSLPSQSTLTASLNTINGVELKTQSLEAPAGKSESNLPFTGIPPGEYILSVRTNQGTVSHLKVVIRR